MSDHVVGRYFAYKKYNLYAQKRLEEFKKV